MNPLERLRDAIDEQERRLRATVPANREAAILALIQDQDRLPTSPEPDPTFDLVTGVRRADLGVNKARQLCLESRADHPGSGNIPAGWAASFIQECRWLTEAAMILAHIESGFMRLAEHGDGNVDAWIATKRAPTPWRERVDYNWWATWLVRKLVPQPEGSANTAEMRLRAMAHQLGYPPGAEIDGCSVQTYGDVLGWLIEWAIRSRDGDESLSPVPETKLVAAIAADLVIEPEVASRAVAAFTLDGESAAWHAALPGVASAPLIRIDQDRLVPSHHGLLAESLLFLARELRRRNAQDYHNAAYLREDVFRQDLYALFQDKRFVTSSGTIELRGADRKIRTDVDAVVFDRKSGALGLFELKSQDPFAGSAAELIRQRDNFLYANRQVSGALDWLNRNGADDLLGRADSRTAKRFRVRKVYPFVLGRYIAHFNNGPAPDRRAAWGSWPQLLRLHEQQPPGTTDSSPIASLHTRLLKDDLAIVPPIGFPPHLIRLGRMQLTIHPSYAAYQASVDHAKQ